MKKLSQPDKLVKLGSPSEKEGGKKENKKIVTEKTSISKNKVREEKPPVESSKQDEPIITEEIYDSLTIGFYKRHIDYMNRRMANKLLQGVKEKQDYNKEVRAIIDEAIERDKK